MESGDDLEQDAIRAYLAGRDADTAALLARAHSAFVASGNAGRAARAAFWIGFVLSSRGDRAQASGWFARARRLVEDQRVESAERGYVLLPEAREHVARGDFAAAAAAFEEAAHIAAAFGDRDLLSLARQGHGRALIALGRAAEGLPLLDEVMVAVTSGEISPFIAGIVYCSVISACVEILDVRRAQEWTEALNRWCASQPHLVPYRGQCLVHRAEILALHGLWPDAITEARRACEHRTQPEPQSVAAAAFYQLAELHRLRGEFAQAEDAYRLAAEAGHSRQPGLALLRLAQGRHEAAKAAITGAREEARGRPVRPGVLAAAIEILLATNDVADARRACNELEEVAGALQTPFVRALSLQASGATLLAEGRLHDALAPMRDARAIWRDLQVPYSSARVALLIARTCRQLGDCDAADIELEAARRTFQALGALPDLEALDAFVASRSRGDNTLTERELQVLKLVASGQTNRGIAQELGISEKTVARHVSNIFTKLDVSSRAAATAYAFTHHLV